MIKLFIGYDRHESVAFHVAAHSAFKNCSQPLSITPLYKHNLKHLMWRPRDPKQSTDFAFSRFLVPYLCNYEGYAIFMDCDMLVRDDIFKLIQIAASDRTKAVWCVKHDYAPHTKRKFLNQKQTVYPKKNWSSVMVFNNELCHKLEPHYINEIASGLDLHQFKWLESDNLIGELPSSYNWLVGEYEKNYNAAILHYTIGTPCFDKYAHCDHSKEWRLGLAQVNECVQSIER